jgi:hypothetical protein
MPISHIAHRDSGYRECPARLGVDRRRWDDQYVSDLLLAPYLACNEPVTVGPWDLVPFRMLHRESDDELENEREWVGEDIREPVMRLVAAYRQPGVGQLGAVVVPKDGKVGDTFDRAAMPRLGHALLAGTIADNPLMTESEDEQPANAGHAAATSENALLYGHPITGGNSYAVENGMLVRVTSLRSAGDEEDLPKIQPPVELARPLFGHFDEEVADAAHALLSAGDRAARRFHRALDWYRIALSNAEAVTLDVRVGAARSAIEVMTGTSDETKKVVRAYGKLMRTEDTRQEAYEKVYWSKGRVELTPDEWWLTRLSELRNAIVHGDEVPDDLWFHDGLHQLNHIHDRLVAMLKQVVADKAGDPLLRLSLGERVWPRIAEEFARRRAEERH